MPRKSAVTLDLSALAAAAEDTGERLVQTRTPVVKTPSPLGAMITKSHETETAVKVPATNDTVKAITAVLRRDAVILGLGVRLKTIEDDKGKVVALEFMGRDQVTRTRKPKAETAAAE